MSQRVALVLSEVFVRRLIPSLAPLVRGRFDFRIIDIRRPLTDIAELLFAINPAALVTEWLPDITPDLLALGYRTIIADTDEVFPGAISIDVDDEAVGAEAANYFLRGGYRHFACVTNGTPYGMQRGKGFAQSLAAAGFRCERRDETESPGPFYMESWRAADARLADWLSALPKPLAVFAVHDPLGRTLCEACRQHGLNVPGEIAILGANNDALVCDLTYPTLSSIIIPWDRIGRAVGDALHQLDATGADHSGPTLVSPGGIMERESTDLVATQDPTLRRCLGYLQAHYREPITIGSMCSELRLSRRSLERCFVQHLARTPWEALCQLRVDKAKRLLAETSHPVARVAELAGFSNAERFSVVFRRISGLTPSAFRNS